MAVLTNLHARAASATQCSRFDKESLDVALLQKPSIHGGKVAGLSPNQFKLVYGWSATRPQACFLHRIGVNCILIPEHCSGVFVVGSISAPRWRSQNLDSMFRLVRMMTITP